MNSKASILFILLSCWCCLLQAQPGVVLHDSLQEAYVVPELRYFADAEANYTIEQISSPAFADSFQLVERERPNFGFLNKPYWFSIRLKHATTQHQEFFFEVNYLPLDTVSYFFKGEDGEWLQQQTGDVFPSKQRPVFHPTYLFRIPAGADSVQEYFFRVHTDGALTFPLSIKHSDQLRQEAATSNFKFGLYYGALLLIFLYHLFLYFSLRINTYLYYCLFILMNIFSQFQLYGHWQHFIWKGGGYFNTVLVVASLFAASASAMVFTMRFLSSKEVFPRFHRWMKALTFLQLTLAVLAFLLPVRYLAATVPVMYMLTVTVILAAAVVAWKKGQLTARFFIVAWLVFLAGLFAYSLQSLGLFFSLESATALVMAGSVLDALLLSLALAERIRQYRLDIQEAQEQMLLALTDKQELLEHQQLLLEQRVSERTLKLQEKQKEAIRQNRMLFEQQQLIEKQNQQLSVLNENQEKIINSRTGELRKANLALLKRNQQLEQFAYIISHNLRGPVASMLGLLRLFDRKKLGSADNEQYLDMLQQSVSKLDTIIVDLGQVLTLEQNLEKYFREICYADVVQGIFQKLQLQVQEAQPQIETDFQEACINSHPSYIESILYNLISNALKYRRQDQALHLTIKSWRKGDQHMLSVADNGLGINLKQHGNRVFSLYQRFHTHVEGKGLGLYMIKRQVESLGGQIDISSQPGEGTAFTISLPQK